MAMYRVVMIDIPRDRMVGKRRASFIWFSRGSTCGSVTLEHIVRSRATTAIAVAAPTQHKEEKILLPLTCSSMSQRRDLKRCLYALALVSISHDQKVGDRQMSIIRK